MGADAPTELIQHHHECANNTPETDNKHQTIVTTMLGNTYNVFCVLENFLLQNFIPKLLEVVHFLIGIKHCSIIQLVIR
jgi:hypothetical protein